MIHQVVSEIWVFRMGSTILEQPVQCILSTFALKNNGKFTHHNSEKLRPRSLAVASTIPVLGLERVCPRKVGPWPTTFFFVLGPEGCVLDSTSAIIESFLALS